MKVLAIILFLFLTIGISAYVLRRDSKVDDGAEPLKVKVPFTDYVLTPSRWFWRKVRENKIAVLCFLVLCVLVAWAV